MRRPELASEIFRALPDDRCGRLTDIIARYVGNGARLRMLDIGCGSGSQIFHLAKRFPDAELIGLDISERSIRAAEELRGERMPKAHMRFVTCDYMAFDDGPFDLITSYGALEHIPVATESLLAKLSTDLLPEGVLVYAMPYDCLYNRTLSRVRRILRRVRSRRTDALIMAIARAVHGARYAPDLLRERLVYMYLAPLRYDSPSLRRAIEDRYGLAWLAAFPEPHLSPAQLRHNVVVHRKRGR